MRPQRVTKENQVKYDAMIAFSDSILEAKKDMKLWQEDPQAWIKAFEAEYEAPTSS